MADGLGSEIEDALVSGDADRLKRLIAVVEPGNGNGITMQRQAALVDVLAQIVAEL